MLFYFKYVLCGYLGNNYLIDAVINCCCCSFCIVLPYCYSDSQIIAQVLGEKTLPIDGMGIPEDVASIIKKCFNYDPKKRPSFSEIINLFQMICTEVGSVTSLIGG
jgi:serine/threonine protein kinase